MKDEVSRDLKTKSTEDNTTSFNMLDCMSSSTNHEVNRYHLKEKTRIRRGKVPSVISYIF